MSGFTPDEVTRFVAWLNGRADQYLSYLNEEKDEPGTYDAEELAQFKAKMHELRDAGVYLRIENGMVPGLEPKGG